MARPPGHSVHLLSRAAWPARLAKHHALGAGMVLISSEKAVGEALCFGWIDSKPNTLDGALAPRLPAPNCRGRLCRPRSCARVRHYSGVIISSSLGYFPPGYVYIRRNKSDSDGASA